MLKKKYLHRKSRDTKRRHTWDVKKYSRGKNRHDFFSEKLPQRQAIRKKYRWYNLDTYPLEKFIESKIGCDWNDVYSEIISKTKPKFRQEIEQTINYKVIKTVFYEDFVPYGMKYRYGKYKILNDVIFIDNNNILVKKTLDEIMLESKQQLRREKLRQIKENQEREELENQELLLSS